MTARLTNNKVFDIKMVEPRSMDLNMYKDIPHKRILYTDINKNFTFRTINDEYPGVDFRSTKCTNDMEKAIKQISNNELEYNKYLAGVEINYTYAKVISSTLISSNQLVWFDRHNQITSLPAPYFYKEIKLLGIRPYL